MSSLLLLQEFSRYLGQQFPHPLRLPGLLSWSWSYNHLLPGSEILAGRAGEVLQWHFPEECWAVALYWARYMEKVDSRGRHKLKWMINLKFIHLSILSLNTLLWSAPKMCPDHCASLGMQSGQDKHPACPPQLKSLLREAEVNRHLQLGVVSTMVGESREALWKKAGRSGGQKGLLRVV